MLNNKTCADFIPLVRCTALRDLTLAFNRHWPDLAGIETLSQLETFHLSGNLLAKIHGYCAGTLAGPATPGLLRHHALPRETDEVDLHAIYWLADHAVGQWSQPVSITVGG